MLNQVNASIEQELDRREDSRESQTVPRFLADALAWMEIQRVGLARLHEYQLEENGRARPDGAGIRSP